jgi:hypothetical protein
LNIVVNDPNKIWQEGILIEGKTSVFVAVSHFRKSIVYEGQARRLTRRVEFPGRL